MPPLHPLIVHFPIGLLVFAFLLDSVARYRSRPDIGRFAWWTQSAGTLGVLLAVGSGLLGASAVTLGGEAREVFQTHEQLAFISSAAMLALFLWRAAFKGSLPGPAPRLYLVAYGAALLILLCTAWYGGELVYGFGAGVRTIPPP